jgi:hypothetical protein
MWERNVGAMMPNQPNFYMVYRDGSSGMTFRHPTFEAAKTEAERLANQCPGVRFFVLQSLGAAIRNDPVTWEQHDELPF